MRSPASSWRRRSPAASGHNGRAAFCPCSRGGTGRACAGSARPARRRCRTRRRHDVEAVGRAILEPGLDVVGDLFRRTGDHPMAACASQALHELADRRLLTVDDVDHQLETAGDAVRAADVDQMTRKGTIEVESSAAVPGVELRGGQRRSDRRDGPDLEADLLRPLCLQGGVVCRRDPERVERSSCAGRYRIKP